jgi:uncharacterized membrane protein
VADATLEPGSSVRSASSAPEPKAAPRRRYASIDWMRGIVMILMVVDHASMAYNGDRFANDSAATWVPGTAIPVLEFVIRAMTHVCAPTFVFLAGTALAIMVEKRLEKGMSPREVDRDMLTRGLLILLVDPILISLGVRLLTFQVMYAIGASMMLMVLIRRLPTALLVVLGVGWMALGEVPTAVLWDPARGSADVPVALAMGWHLEADLKIIYPLLPWLAMMMLGWVFGRQMLLAREGRTSWSPPATIFAWGAIALAVFVAVRGLNGYGNMMLPRDDGSLLQWLHVSKYPPSLAFSGLQLGTLFVSLGALMVLEPRLEANKNGVLLVFGQTAFFFYVVHRAVFDFSAHWFGLSDAWGLGASLLASLAMLVALYPACRWYRSFKRAHPESVLRFF